VLRKIKGFRIVTPSRFANRWHVEGGWRLGKQGLPHFVNVYQSRRRHVQVKVFEYVWNWRCHSTTLDKFLYYPYCSRMEDTLLYMKFTLYLSSSRKWVQHKTQATARNNK
jgi:hypothetical protein